MKNGLVDRQGVSVPLGREIARGGEGAIHEIKGHPKFVAKIYHQRPSKAKAAKLEAMVAAQTKRLIQVAAWPVEVIRDGKGRTVGVVMPRIDGFKEIHLLYGPRSRQREFPLASWAFLARSAANLARAFAVVHDHGHVIGDVNDKLALVSDRTTVRLIDCDSFQIKVAKKAYTCDVGVLTHQPPEMQGVTSFRGRKRTKNHDNFGLAVLIFQMLFMARHPFSGQHAKGATTLEAAIKEHHYVYGKKAGERGLSPPPCSLSMEEVTPRLRQLFERAFAPSSTKGKRPKPAEWAEALEEFQKSLRPCKSNPNHAYLKGRSCPFCPLESQSGSALFALPILFRTATGKKRTALLNIGSVWKDIRTVPPPTNLKPFAQLPQVVELLRPTGGRALARILILIVAGLLVTGVVAGREASGDLSFFGLLALPFFWPLWQRFSMPLRNRGKIEELRETWEKTRAEYLEYGKGLARAKKELDGLGAEHERNQKRLHSRRRHDQLAAYLDKKRVAAATIPGVASALVVILQSYGIETAKDVTRERLAEVPCMGPSRVRALLGWRQDLEAAFVFDSARGVDPVAYARVERETEMKRARLVQTLSEGPAKLRHLSESAGRKLAAVQAELDRLTGS